MEGTKSTREVMQKAAELKGPLVEWARGHLTSGFGNEIDQLRVVGYLCERVMELVETELRVLKVQGEEEGPRIKVYQ